MSALAANQVYGAGAPDARCCYTTTFSPGLPCPASTPWRPSGVGRTSAEAMAIALWRQSETHHWPPGTRLHRLPGCVQLELQPCMLVEYVVEYAEGPPRASRYESALDFASLRRRVFNREVVILINLDGEVPA